MIVVTSDPRDAERVAGALGLLERYLRADGLRLPESLRCPVVHAYDASRRPEATKVGDSTQLPDDAHMPLLTYAEAAARLRVSLRTVQRAVARGALPARRLGRRRLIHRDDLAAFAASLPTNGTIAS